MYVSKALSTPKMQDQTYIPSPIIGNILRLSKDYRAMCMTNKDVFANLRTYFLRETLKKFEQEYIEDHSCADYNLKTAVKSGSMHIVTHYLRDGGRCWEDCIVNATSNGLRNMLQFFLDKYIHAWLDITLTFLDTERFSAQLTSRINNIFIHNHKCMIRATFEAVRNEHFDILTDLLPSSPSKSLDQALLFATQLDRRDYIEYLIARGATTAKNALEIAASDGNMDLVRRFVTLASDMDTALIRAAERGHHDVVRFLLDRGATGPETALNAAAERCRRDMFQYITSNYVIDIDTILREASRMDDVGLVERCVLMGAKDLNGALANAVDHRRTPNVKLLLDFGANDIQTASGFLDSGDHMTRLVLAMHENGSFMSHHGLISAIIMYRNDLVTFFVERRGLENLEDALNVAVAESNTFAISYLASRLDIEALNSACTLATELKVLRILQENGANDLNARACVFAKLGLTDVLQDAISNGADDIDAYLGWAIRRNRSETASFIVNTHHASLDLNLALETATTYQNVSTMNLLIQYGANDFNRALIQAIEWESEKMVSILLEKGADDFNSALTFAAAYGHTDMVTSLIDMGADDLNLALVSAAENEHFDIVKILAEAGATDFENAMNRTPPVYHALVKYIAEKITSVDFDWEAYIMRWEFPCVEPLRYIVKKMITRSYN